MWFQVASVISGVLKNGKSTRSILRTKRSVVVEPLRGQCGKVELVNQLISIF